MYDNKLDEYQMKNLAGVAAHADLQKQLDGKLQLKLKQTGDKLLPKQHYLKEWGYTVGRGGNIPYFSGKKPDSFKVQSPKPNRPSFRIQSLLAPSESPGVLSILSLL